MVNPVISIRSANAFIAEKKVSAKGRDTQWALELEMVCTHLLPKVPVLISAIRGSGVSSQRMVTVVDSLTVTLYCSLGCFTTAGKYVERGVVKNVSVVCTWGVTQPRINCVPPHA